MCELRPNLVAWLDRELPPELAAVVQDHLAACEECRRDLEALRQTSQSFNACCDAVLASSTKRKIPVWVPVLAGVAAVAILTLFLAIPRRRPEPSAKISVPSVVSAGALPTIPPSGSPRPTPGLAVHRVHRVPRTSQRVVAWRPAEQAVEIAIPADAMFAPGALPQGVEFFAEMSIAPDGSVRQVRLRQ